MARPPLAVVVVIVVAAAIPGAAQLSTEAKSAVDGARKQAAGLFEKGENLASLDLTVLTARADALGARRQVDELLAQVSRARYLQPGREAADDKDAYKAMLRATGRALGADQTKVIAAYGELVRPPRMGQTPSVEEMAARNALMEQLAKSSTLTPEQKARFATNLRLTSDALIKTMPALGLESAFGGGSALSFESRAVAAPSGQVTTLDFAFSDLPPQVQPIPLRTNATPPPAGKTPLSWSSLSSVFDWSKAGEIVDSMIESVNSVGKKVIKKGGEIVKTIYTETSNFTGYCYRYVKKGLGLAGMDTDGNGACYVGQGHAYQFAAALNKCPKLMEEMKLRPLDPASLAGDDPASVPAGSILVYDRGCAGMSSDSGHIEVTLSRDRQSELPARVTNRLRLADNHVLACSDGCSGRTLAYLRTYGTTTKARKKCLNMFVPVRS